MVTTPHCKKVSCLKQPWNLTDIFIRTKTGKVRGYSALGMLEASTGKVHSQQWPGN